MSNVFVTVLIILMWIITIYFTLYCLKTYIDKKNAFYACFLHLLILFLWILTIEPQYL